MFYDGGIALRDYLGCTTVAKPLLDLGRGGSLAGDNNGLDIDYCGDSTILFYSDVFSIHEPYVLRNIGLRMRRRATSRASKYELASWSSEHETQVPTVERCLEAGGDLGAPTNGSQLMKCDENECPRVLRGPTSNGERKQREQREHSGSRTL